MKTQPLGFSLIELMMVVAIISILSMMALPVYHNYTARARFTEVLMQAHVYQMAIALALQSGIPFNELNTGENGIPPPPSPTVNLASLIVNHGIITARATTAANDASLILTPNEDGSHFSLSGSCVTLGYCHE